MRSLYRSKHDSQLFGLCGGLAQSTGIESGWIRFGFIIALFLTGGTLFLFYILASLVIPKEPDGHMYSNPNPYAFQPSYPTGATAAAGYTSASDPREVDAMIRELEQTALKKELQALRNKVAQYEHETSKMEGVQ